jgi:putative ABC transport system permease protein
MRLLLKSPMFTVVVVATLGLGVGATTTIFVFVNALLLKPLPYADADELVVVWQDFSQRGGPRTEWTSPGTFLDWRSNARSFSAMTVVQDWGPTLTGLGQPEQINAAQVASGFLRVFGIAPLLGRDFRSDEETGASSRVVLVSSALWHQRLNGDPAAVGRTIILDGEPHVVIGVLPPGFRPALAPLGDVYRPMRLTPETASHADSSMRTIARLRPGVSLTQAHAEMSALSRSLERTYPQAYGRTNAWLEPLQDVIVGNARAPLLVLFAAVLLVLLIACVNITNLLLARASVRQREMAVRTALGAGRPRLLRQLVTESLLISTIGAMAGFLFASWMLDGLTRKASLALPAAVTITADHNVVLFAAITSFAAAMVFGLPSAFHAISGNLSLTLRQSARSGGGGARARSVLVVVELALAVMLLVGAGLLIRSLLHLKRLDPGFNLHQVLTAQLTLPQSRYAEPVQIQEFWDTLLQQIRRVDNVEAAGLVSVLPLSGYDTDVRFTIEGRPSASSGDAPSTWFRIVDPGYFRALGIRLVRGRFFTDNDVQGAQQVAIVNETMVRRLFAGRDPIGQALRLGRDRRFVIVGIVSDVRHRGPQEAPQLETYLPNHQIPRTSMTIVLRTTGEPEDVAPALRSVVQRVDPLIPLASVSTMEQLMAQVLTVPRMLSVTLLAFAALALLLAAIGTYGVVAYSVSRRTQEIGVRMALGAVARDVLGMVLVQAGWLALAGVLIGTGAALALSRLLASELYGVSSTDPLTFVVTATLLVMVTLVASYIPARRAVHVDPVTALRSE